MLQHVDFPLDILFLLWIGEFVFIVEFDGNFCVFLCVRSEFYNCICAFPDLRTYFIPVKFAGKLKLWVVVLG